MPPACKHLMVAALALAGIVPMLTGCELFGVGVMVAPPIKNVLSRCSAPGVTSANSAFPPSSLSLYAASNTGNLYAFNAGNGAMETHIVPPGRSR